jgi:hypothetical protein
MCAEGFEKFFENMEKLDPALHEATTRHFEQGSKGMESLGERWNMPLVADDARLYQDDPEKGLGRASAITASFMAPYALGGVGAAAGAAGQAGQAATTAEQMSQIAMMEMMDPALMGAGQGLLQGAQTAPSSLEMGLLGQGGLDPETMAGLGGMNPRNGQLMEAGLTDTGYTPSNLYHAFNNANAGNGTPLNQNLSNWADQMKVDFQNGAMKNRVGLNLQNQNRMQMMKMGQGMMEPKPQQQQPMPQPRQQQGPQQPLGLPYDRPPPGMKQLDPRMLSEEEKQRLRAMGVRI